MREGQGPGELCLPAGGRHIRQVGARPSPGCALPQPSAASAWAADGSWRPRVLEGLDAAGWITAVMQSPSSPPLLPGNRREMAAVGPGPEEAEGQRAAGWLRPSSRPELDVEADSQPPCGSSPAPKPWWAQEVSCTRFRNECARERERRTSTKTSCFRSSETLGREISAHPQVLPPSWHFPVSVSTGREDAAPHQAWEGPAPQFPRDSHPDGL